ncbi:MAG: hypothetical protein H0V44_11220 [Planctomycetes bacterium]|nr:hypothetical protein [Planctomycetota bacterium]
MVGRIPDEDTALLVLWGLCCLDDLAPHTDYWLDPVVPGALTPVKPTEDPRLILHSAEGRLCVVRTGGGGGGASATTFADLTDVDVTTTPPTDGQAAVWNDAEQLWMPRDIVASDPVDPHLVLIGPTSDPADTPTFRLLELDDLPELAATSVVVNATATAGKPSALAADADDRVLMRAAETLQWLTITTAAIGDAQVTDAKIQSVAWTKITGTPTAFPPTAHDHVLGGDLTGTTSAAAIAPGAVDTSEIANGAITRPKLAPITGPAVLGRATGTGLVNALSPATEGEVLRQQGGVLGFGLIGDDSIDPAAGIAWSKLDTTDATPADVGAAPASHTHLISELSDVQVVSPTIGQVLVWNATLGVWQNDDPADVTGLMAARSVWANPTGAPAEGVSVTAGADNQVLMRVSGTLQFAALTPASWGDRLSCSVIGRSSINPGPAADIQAPSNDSVLMRVTDTLQWLTTVPRMKFGNSPTGSIEFINSGGFVSHEYISLNTSQAWKQHNNGRTRFYYNGSDYWEISANGQTIELSGWVSGTIRHRISLNANANLGGASRTLSLREIDVCENGIAKRMAVLASAPY